MVALAEVIASARPARRLGPLAPYLYLAPLLLVLLAFTFWPLLHAFWLSFEAWNLNPGQPSRFVGLANYDAVLGSSLFEAALANTGVYLLASIPLKVGLPLPVALFLWTLKNGGGAYRTALFLPTLVSFVAVAVAWSWLLSPLGGYLAVLLQGVGLRVPGLLTHVETALVTILGISSWKVFGFNVLLYLAGLTRIERAVVEAARMDGAGAWRIVRDHVVPLIGPSLVLVTVTTLIFTMQQVFTPIDVLTRGGPANSTTNLFYVTYQYTFASFDVGQGAASTVLLFALLLLVALTAFRLFERRVHYRE